MGDDIPRLLIHFKKKTGTSAIKIDDDFVENAIRSFA
jgi:hypothetical protein